ncbi:MAG: hypothetical protein WCB35_09395 [Methanoregula sp.]|uniref:hypothetical protein n=1 Tax=Methanoregula sp. TaxID=2052170 RepID=UPI003C7209AA
MVRSWVKVIVTTLGVGAAVGTAVGTAVAFAVILGVTTGVGIGVGTGVAVVGTAVGVGVAAGVDGWDVHPANRIPMNRTTRTTITFFMHVFLLSRYIRIFYYYTGSARYRVTCASSPGPEKKKKENSLAGII